MKNISKLILLIASFLASIACGLPSTINGIPSPITPPTSIPSLLPNNQNPTSQPVSAPPTSAAQPIAPTTAPNMPTLSPSPTTSPSNPAQPPGGNNNAPEPVTITNLTSYPQGAVYYGNCTTEETIFNLQATIGPEVQISSVMMYYAYRGSTGTYGNSSTPMSILGIGDYSGDANVGIEAAFGLGENGGSLDAYVNVIDVHGNSIDSNWVSIPVVYCPGTALGDPPQAASVVSKGGGAIYNNYSLDLGDGNGDDLIFSHTNSDGLQLLNVWGTELRIDLYADVESCKQAMDSGPAFTAVTIDSYDVICYKTGSGNYGYLTVDGIFVDLDDHNNSYADISYTTEVMP